jgi:hypothetical protein
MESVVDSVPHQHAIRVLVAYLANTQPSILEQLALEPDIVVVAEVRDHDRTPSRIELLVAAGADIHVVVLVATRAYPLPAICSHLLHEYPHLRILVVPSGRRRPVLYWLGLRHRRIPGGAVRLSSSIRNAHAIDAMA